MSARAARRRLDAALVEDGLAPTREKAQALVLAGRVLVDGTRWDKPGSAVPAGATIAIAPGDRPYASRGGVKLAGALDALGIDPAGRRCLDVGASTGGFTDVLLRRGAAHVTALDVGRGLIDDALRRDPRVVVVEGVNARNLRPELVAPPYGLVVVDVSFISLALVLPAVVPLVSRPDAPPGLHDAPAPAATAGSVLALVKPQFEAGRAEVARGAGVVRDPAVRGAAVARVAEVLAGLGCGLCGVAASPLAGPRGNREVFLWASPGAPGLPAPEWRARIDEEVRRDPD